MSKSPPHPDWGIGQVPVCTTCGSERILRNAHTIWNPAFGLWEISSVLDHFVCEACGGPAVIHWIEPEMSPTETIRLLNDELRIHGRGNGRIVVTNGIQERGEDFVAKALVAMHSFDKFSPENDFYGEHDFGAFEVDGEKLFFKIDYYDPTLSFGSENPANPMKTVRVLTLMLANEY